MTGTNAICKKINAGSQGNNQTVLRVHCSLTETWSANTEKCSIAMLLILLPSYYGQAFQTIRSASHSFQTHQINPALIFAVCSGVCIMKTDLIILRWIQKWVFSTFTWIINVKNILTGLQTNYFKLGDFFLSYKGAGCNYFTPLFKDALKHLFLSANQNFFQAWRLCVSPRASFYAHFKCNTRLGFLFSLKRL